MRIYTVHYRPGSPEPDGETLLVREGFAWLAFLVAPLWLLWHRLWLAFVLVVLAGLALDLVLQFSGADALSVFAAGVGLSAFVGFGANDWRRAKLTRRGYRLAGVVAAVDRDSALRRFFDLHPDFPAPVVRGTAIGGL